MIYGSPFLQPDTLLKKEEEEEEEEAEEGEEENAEGAGAKFFFPPFSFADARQGQGGIRSREPVPDCQPDLMAPPSLGSRRAQNLLRQQAKPWEAN